MRSRSASSAAPWGLALGCFLIGLVILNYRQSLQGAADNYQVECRQQAELDQNRFEEVLRLLQEMLKLVAEDPYIHTFVDSGGTLPPHSKSRIVPAFELLTRRLGISSLVIVGFKPSPHVYLELQGPIQLGLHHDAVLQGLRPDLLEVGKFLTVSNPEQSQTFLYCYPISHNDLIVGVVALQVPKQQLLDKVSSITQFVGEEPSGLKVENSGFGGAGRLCSLILQNPGYPNWRLSASRPDSDFYQREDVQSAKSLAWFGGVTVLLSLGLTAIWLNRRQVMEQSRAKSEFLATLSHEIRNPLSGILSINKLAQETSLDPLQSEYLEISSKAAASTLQLLQDTLEMSRLEAGTLELCLTPTDIRSSLHQAVRPLATQAERKGLLFHCGVSPDVPAQLLLDAPRIKQVILNLLGNALKFTESGSIEVSAEWVNGALSVEVRDTGCGIEQSKLDRIFEPYGQVGEQSHQGVGLGLHISHEIVAAMGGELKVESQESVGTVFEFAIMPEIIDSSTLTLPESIRTRHILVWEPQTFHRDRLVGLLSRWGLKMECLDDIPTDNPGDDQLLLALAQPELMKTLTQSVVFFADLATTGLPPSTSGQRVLRRPVSESKLADAMIELTDGIGAPQARPERSVAKTVRILLAEDSPIHQRFTTRMLESAGYDVTLAEDGKEALNLVSKSDFDLLLLDVRMPGISGLEVARQLRAGAGSRIPIIGLTANAIGKDKERCLESGMDRYLPKPYEESQLLALIREVVPKPPPSRGTLEQTSSIFSPEKALTSVGGNPQTLASLTEFFITAHAGLLAEIQVAIKKDAADELAGATRVLASMVAPLEAGRLQTRILKLSQEPESWVKVKSDVEKLCRELSAFTSKREEETSE